MGGMSLLCRNGPHMKYIWYLAVNDTKKPTRKVGVRRRTRLKGSHVEVEYFDLRFRNTRNAARVSSVSACGRVECDSRGLGDPENELEMYQCLENDGRR